jgi:hypothetical protein
MVETRPASRFPTRRISAESGSNQYANRAFAELVVERA